VTALRCETIEHLPHTRAQPPDSVAPDSALLRLLKAADALRKKGGDSHIAVDHMVLAALGDSQLSKLLTEGA